MDLNKCSGDCLTCIKHYKKKHPKQKKFDIKCKGILSEDVINANLDYLPEEQRLEARAIWDPVTWAAQNLDWHCLDPDGSVWRRKNPEEYYAWVKEHPGEDILGHSRYHRPYQAIILKCSSKYKVLRIGRQCLTGDTLISMADGTFKQIKDVTFGEQVISLGEDMSIKKSTVLEQWNSGIKKTYQIKTRSGHTVKCTSNHKFFIINNKVDYNNTFEKADKQWLSIDTGLQKGSHIAILSNKSHLSVDKKVTEACKKAYIDIDTIFDKHNRTTNDILWDTVSEIKELEYEETYDLEVEETHNFVSNGIFCHNCGKTEGIVINILYHMFTNRNYHVLLVTPRQSQIELIFSRMKELILDSFTLSNSIARSTKGNSYLLELNNRSYVKGFTAGSGSGGEGTSIRGQHANMLCLDEADFLDTADLGAALAVTTNFPDAKILMSSTPIGKREKFYEANFLPHWKGFHYPSYVNPMWSDEIDHNFRMQYTESQYRFEILAEFASQTEGVFQVQYIENAQHNYEYEEMRPNPNWVYTMGVDWNDYKTGTNIYILGFNPTTRTFQGVYREIVSRQGWTQTLACKRIAELNRIWNLKHIYIDYGAGAAQEEFLKMYSYQATMDPGRGPGHPDSKIKNILKTYNFGTKLEVHDLFTSEKVKKDSKPWLVETTVRLFESSSILIPKSDELLYKQLLNYIVVRIGSNGQPIYGMNNEEIGDHMLDALMLSVVAYYMEETAFGGSKTFSPIVYTKPIGYASPIDEERPDNSPSMDRENKILSSKTRTLMDPLPAANTNKVNTIKLKEERRYDGTRKALNIFRRSMRPQRKHF